MKKKYLCLVYISTQYNIADAHYIVTHIFMNMFGEGNIEKMFGKNGRL